MQVLHRAGSPSGLAVSSLPVHPCLMDGTQALQRPGPWVISHASPGLGMRTRMPEKGKLTSMMTSRAIACPPGAQSRKYRRRRLTSCWQAGGLGSPPWFSSAAACKSLAERAGLLNSFVRWPSTVFTSTWEYNFKRRDQGRVGTCVGLEWFCSLKQPQKRERTGARGRAERVDHVWVYTLLHTNPNGRNGNFLTFVLLTKQPGHHARNWPFFVVVVQKEMEKSPQQNVVIFLYCGKKNKRLLEDLLTITATDQLKPRAWTSIESMCW